MPDFDFEVSIHMIHIESTVTILSQIVPFACSGEKINNKCYLTYTVHALMYIQKAT